MPVNSRFLAARAAEYRQRDLVHASALCWLPLRRRGVIMARTPLVPYTFRHRIELRLAGNAFFTRALPQPADVFLFLWRLHPLHRAPILGREWAVVHLAGSRLRLLRLWYALGSFRLACLHRGLSVLVRRCDLFAAAENIAAFLELAQQDAPGMAWDESSRAAPAAPEPHDADNHCDWLMTRYRMSHAEALDTPIALAHQLYRESLLRTPDGALNVFAPSDALLA